jgi:hypothetical protein
LILVIFSKQKEAFTPHFADKNRLDYDTGSFGATGL